jgi:hypothetical protein
MQPSSEPGSAVAQIMRRHRIEQILDVPALPATSGLRYQRSVRLQPHRDLWFLRSFGSDFALIPKNWLRSGLNRCYSLGASLDEGPETGNLLLVQAFTATPAEAERLTTRLAIELEHLVDRQESRVDQEYDRPCMWLAATVRQRISERVHG